jgi:hypothetical protein
MTLAGNPPTLHRQEQAMHKTVQTKTPSAAAGPAAERARQAKPAPGFAHDGPNGAAQRELLQLARQASPASAHRETAQRFADSPHALVQRRTLDMIGAKTAQKEAREKGETPKSDANKSRLSSGLTVIQKAATVNQAGGGNSLANHRTLHSTEYQGTFLNLTSGPAFRERISVYGNPGFGTNLGRINGNGNIEIRPSVQGVAHSEPILIGRSYGAIQNNPTWPQANAAVDNSNMLAGGAANRNHFTLYTERHPCGGCGPSLANARYHANDAVNWRYPLNGHDTSNIANSHIPRAINQFHYNFVVDAHRPWRLAGWRIFFYGKPKDQGKQKTGGDPPSKKIKIETASSSNAVASGNLIDSSSSSNAVLV